MALPDRTECVGGTGEIVQWIDAIGCHPEEAMGHLYAKRPAWVHGYISYTDARYLLRRTLACRADTVLEIGTASGVSTAVLCHALSLASRADLIDADFEVRTYDVSDRFYADVSKPTGEAAREMLPPELLRHVIFRSPATAAILAADAGPDTVDFMFVDADHRHPWPALDVLATADCMRRGAEVVLHDINLPLLRPDYPDWGAKHLFDGLDAEKRRSDLETLPNIGSVWIPDDKERFKAQLQEIVWAHEWQASVPEEVTAPLLR